MRWPSLLLLLFVVTNTSLAQETIPSFNKSRQSQVGLALAITGFNSNVNYFVSPYYAFHLHRHWFAATPFYGRLGALNGQQDLGIGVDYRLYPFKNLERTRIYFPMGLHYTYTWTKSSSKNGLLYTAGFGTEADLGKHFLLSLDINVGIGQNLSSAVSASETATFGSTNPLNFYFLPVIRIAYGL